LARVEHDARCDYASGGVGQSCSCDHELVSDTPYTRDLTTELNQSSHTLTHPSSFSFSLDFYFITSSSSFSIVTVSFSIVFFCHIFFFSTTTFSFYLFQFSFSFTFFFSLSLSSSLSFFYSPSFFLSVLLCCINRFYEHVSHTHRYSIQT
jgi:hypothetical protein